MSIEEILESLNRRGFYNGQSLDALELQVYAVQEELGEVARKIRRYRQGVEKIDLHELAVECADTAIASVCLVGAACGDDASDFIRAKMRNDEARGRLHNEKV